MKAALYLDGRRVGEDLVFEQPKNDRGETVQLPTMSDEFESEAAILIRDDDGNGWFGRTKLQRHAIERTNPPPPVTVLAEAAPSITRFQGIAEEGIVIGAAVDIDLDSASGRMVVRAARA